MIADFILSFLNDLFQFVQLGCAETFVDGQFDFRLQPELRLAVRRNHMDVHPRFFTREEIKSVISIPKNRRTHLGTIPNPPNDSTCISRRAAEMSGGDCLKEIGAREEREGKQILHL
jgi:hypothetical protein